MKGALWISTLLYCCIQYVSAVFTDEIDVTDWALQSIGKYECIFPISNNNKTLVMVSHLHDTSMISLVNKTSGQLIARRVSEYKINDIKLNKPNGNIIIEYETDSKWAQLNIENANIYTPRLESVPVDNLSTLCQVGTENNNNDLTIDLEKNVLQIIDPDSKLTILSTQLPTDFQKLVFYTTDHAQELETIWITNDNKYVYSHWINDKLINQWFRDESLANIIDHQFINIDDHSIDSIIKELIDETNFDHIWDAYIFRLKTNIDRLVKFVKLNNYSPGRMITDLLQIDLIKKENDDKRSDLRNLKDLKFGFQKLLVVLNEDGKIMGLDMNNLGDNVWDFQSKLTGPFVSLKWDEDDEELVIFNQFGDYEIWEFLTPLVAPILKRDGKLNINQCHLRQINKLDGIDNTYFVEFTESESTCPGVLVSLTEKEPKIDYSTRKFITTHDETTVQGHIISNNKLIPTWKIRVNEDNEEKIVAFSNRPNVNIVNPGIILGNREVLYKYLYPNIASYIVFNGKTNQMYINVIDTVKGEILVSQIHDQEFIDIDYPINLVVGEHWIVYTYFSLEPIPEQKINVIELYESLTPNERKSNPDEDDVNPLIESFTPEFMTRSYYFPEVITKMGISNTKFDITTTALVLELENGQVSFLPKNVISARRKLEADMTDDDKKEFMASPYVPGIPINDNYIITHVRDLIFDKDSQIASVATNLESTTIVCDIGHDIFCSRITPSGQFDVLNPNFETGKLVFSILICFVLFFVLRPYVTKRHIKSLWLVRE